MRAPTAAALLLVAVAGCGADRRAQPPAVLAVRVPTGALSGEYATASALGAGRALTVAHVLRAGRPVVVGGRRARILRVDRTLDLATLAVPGLRAPAPARAAAASAGERVGVRVLRDGATRTLPATVRRVITARVSGGGVVEVRPALELATAVLPGDSGAPVVAPDGRVVGVVFARVDGSAGIAYAVRLAGPPSPPARPARAG
jgi:S1-C subfamily serine protease